MRKSDKTEEVEWRLRQTIEIAIDGGALLIRHEYGVSWDDNRKLWLWDNHFSPVPSCCVVGAYLLSGKDVHDAEQHRGDHYTAVLHALDIEMDWLCSLVNGFDGEMYNSSWIRDAWVVGDALAKEYKPLDIDLLREAHGLSDPNELGPEASSGVRLCVPTSDAEGSTG